MAGFAKIEFDTKGFENHLKTVYKDKTRKTTATIAVMAQRWEGKVKDSAPADHGRLRQQISSFKISDFAWEVVSAADYSAYMEWGTGIKVSVPAGLQSYASGFRGSKGKGNPKALIYAWCKRKGIEEGAWYAIYISIMVNGVRPQPFFFIHKVAIEKEFVDQLIKIWVG